MGDLFSAHRLGKLHCENTVLSQTPDDSRNLRAKLVVKHMLCHQM
jgi:hypothetical protein